MNLHRFGVYGLPSRRTLFILVLAALAIALIAAGIVPAAGLVFAAGPISWQDAQSEHERRRRLGELMVTMRGILTKAQDANASDLTRTQETDFNAAYREFNQLAEDLGTAPIGQTGRALRSISAAIDAADLLLSGPIEGGPGPIRMEPRNADGSYGSPANRDLRTLPLEQRFADLPEVRNLPGADLSLTRWLRAKMIGDWTGIDPAIRAMSVGSDTLGGYLVPTALSARLIDMARARAVVMRLGALTIPMTTAEMSIPSLDGDVTAAWKLENVAGTFSNATFGKRTMRPQTVAAFSRMSIELAEDGNDPTGIVERSMADALALALDLAALRGTGAGAEPLGIRNWGNGVTVTDIGTNGTAGDHDDLIDVVTRRRAANEEPNGLAWHPTIAGSYAKLKDGGGEYLPFPEPVARLNRQETSQIPMTLTLGTTTGTCSEIYVGDWSNLLIGMRTNLTIEASRHAAQGDESAFSAMQVWLRAYMRVDVSVARGSAFEVLNGVTA